MVSLAVPRSLLNILYGDLFDLGLCYIIDIRGRIKKFLDCACDIYYFILIEKNNNYIQCFPHCILSMGGRHSLNVLPHSLDPSLI